MRADGREYRYAVCMNFLDSFGASGVLKAYMLRRLDGSKEGLEPACVNNCANGALRCIDAQEFKTVKVNESLRKMMGKG